MSCSCQKRPEQISYDLSPATNYLGDNEAFTDGDERACRIRNHTEGSLEVLFRGAL